MATESKNNDVLQSIQQPEQREMLRRYHLAQNVLEDARRSPHDDAKMAEHREAMQDFSLLRDRRGVVKLPEQPVAKKRRLEDGDINDDDEVKMSEAEKTDSEVVDVLPDSQKENAQKMLQLLRAHGEEIISWSPRGDVSIHGERLQGLNIADLVNDVLQSSRSSTRSMPQQESFLTALADANVPEALIKNKAALELYREIKNDYSNEDSDNDFEVSSTTASSSQSEKGYKTTKKATKGRDVLKDVIDWNAPL